jgi:hypothetical protein
MHFLYSNIAHKVTNQKRVNAVNYFMILQGIRLYYQDGGPFCHVTIRWNFYSITVFVLNLPVLMEDYESGNRGYNFIKRQD